MGNIACKGYPDPIGGRSRLWIGDHTGPASYVAGGETIAASAGGALQNSTTSIITGLSALNFVGVEELSASGNYQISAVAPTTVGGTKQTTKLKWFYAPTQGINSILIATAGSGQTNGTYVITDSGSNFTGSAAKVQIVVAGAAVTKATIVFPGTGYFGAATFTVAAGGTPGTLTSTYGSSSGIEVAAATNLSAESVRLTAIG